MIFLFEDYQPAPEIMPSIIPSNPPFFSAGVYICLYVFKFPFLQILRGMSLIVIDK